MQARVNLSQTMVLIHVILNKIKLLLHSVDPDENSSVPAVFDCD